MGSRPGSPFGLEDKSPPEPPGCLILEDLQTLHIPTNKKLVLTQYRLLLSFLGGYFSSFQENFEAKTYLYKILQSGKVLRYHRPARQLPHNTGSSPWLLLTSVSMSSACSFFAMNCSLACVALSKASSDTEMDPRQPRPPQYPQPAPPQPALQVSPLPPQTFKTIRIKILDGFFFVLVVNLVYSSRTGQGGLGRGR